MIPEALPTTAPHRPLRRFFVLSLRMLLVLIALLAVWLAWLTNRARRQAEVVRELQTKRYPFGFDYEYPPGGIVPAATKLPNAQPQAPAWLRRAVGEEYFRRLALVGWDGHRPPRPPRKIDSNSTEQREDDAFLRKLSARGGLRVLSLMGLDVSGQALADCAGTLGDLESLAIGGCPNVDDQVFSLVERLPKLEFLSIQGCPISGRRFAAIARCPALRQLNVFSDTLRGEDLKPLRALRNLDWLALKSPLITDASLAELDFTKLTFLYLSSERVTGAGLRSVGGLTNLSELYLDCSANDEGIQVLHPLQKLTKLAIWSSGETLSDRALAAIKSFPKLQRLAIGGSDGASTTFSDRALIELVRALPALRSLELEREYLDHKALKDLQVDRPSLQIRRVQ